MIVLYILIVLSSNLFLTINGKVTFLVDTSEISDPMNKTIILKQSIGLWNKYLGPDSSQDMDINELQTDCFFGLEIDGLKNSSKNCIEYGYEIAMSELSNDDILIVIASNENLSINDTIFDEIKEKHYFKISTIILSEHEPLDSDVERLAYYSNGKTDYINRLSVERFLRSFSMLSNQQYFLILNSIEFEQTNENICNVKFSVNELFLEENSLIEMFICPTLLNGNFHDLIISEDFSHSWQDEINCWVATIRNQKINKYHWDFPVRLSESDTFSVFVVLKNSINYPRLNCERNVMESIDIVNATIFDIKVIADLEQYSYNDISIFAVIGNDDDPETIVLQYNVENNKFFNCVPPTNTIGRQSVYCYAMQNSFMLQTTQTASFKVSEWPKSWPVNDCKLKTYYQNFTTIKPYMENTTIFDTSDPTDPSDESDGRLNYFKKVAEFELMVFVIALIILLEIAIIYMHCTKVHKSRYRNVPTVQV